MAKIFCSFLTISFLTLLMACSGGGKSNNSPTNPTPSSTPVTFTVQCGTQLSTGNNMDIVTNSTSPSDVQLITCFQGSMPSIMASNTIVKFSDLTTHDLAPWENIMTCAVSTEINGMTVGYAGPNHGVSQTFSASDPSISEAIPEGTVGSVDPTAMHLGADPGFFMCNFTKNTKVNALCISPCNLTQFNEFYIKFSTYNPLSIVTSDGHKGIVDSSLQFLTGDPLVRYSSYANNLALTTNSDTSVTPQFNSILMIPKSKLPTGSTFTSQLVTYPTAVDPVTGDIPVGFVEGNEFRPTLASKWTLLPAETWNALPGNAGILSVVDSICGTDRTSQTWLDTALYFQNLLVKFYAVNAACFFRPSLDSSSHVTPYSLNQGTSFLVCVFDDSMGMFQLGTDSVLNLNFNPTLATYAVTDSKLVVTGNPPINFTITQQSKN